MTRSVLAHAGTWILDGQASMSKEGDSPDYEYWRRLREHKVRSNRLSWMVMSALADISVYLIFLHKFCHMFPIPEGHVISLTAVIFSFFNSDVFKKSFPKFYERI